MSLEGRDPAPGIVAVLAEKARLETFAGRLDEAEAYEQRTRSSLPQRLELEELQANVLGTLGVIAMHRGDVRQSRVHLEEALSRTRAPPSAYAR